MAAVAAVAAEQASRLGVSQAAAEVTRTRCRHPFRPTVSTTLGVSIYICPTCNARVVT